MDKEDCETAVENAFKKEPIKAILEEIGGKDSLPPFDPENGRNRNRQELKADCPLPTPEDIHCDCCDDFGYNENIGGRYNHPLYEFFEGEWVPITEKRNIQICRDRISQNEAETVLRHELIHWLNNCEAGYTGGRDCDTIICDEIKAYNLSGQCDGRENRKNCIMRGVQSSAGGSGNCPKAGEELWNMIEAEYDRCTGLELGDDIF